jgi:DNA polymerase
MEEEVDHQAIEAQKVQELKQLKEKCSTCQQCELHQSRSEVIFGQGPLQADIMFISSAPSQIEEASHEPFKNDEGQLLDRMFEKMGYQREQLYLCYAAPCRPPNDRPPNAEELLSCRPWLKEQIELVQPKFIVTLGTVATQALLQIQLPISKLRGQWQEIQTKLGKTPVMPTFHPGFLLKKPAARKDVWSDMVGILDAIKARK